MNFKTGQYNNVYRHFLFFLIMLIGIIVRIWRFSIVPADINQDEAFAGYEAYSLLHYGADSSGYPFPVYFVSWGSGMNALEIYLMIPFVALLGLTTYAIRMPQFIVSCFTLLVIFLLAKKIFDSNVCFLVLFLTAISPWHIMLSKWGLESNLAPAFLIFGLYFFILGTEKPGFFILSSFFYGLSLYCYATVWIVLPVILFLQIIYCLYHKKIFLCVETLISVVLLSALAIPLFLFLLINYNIIPEIKTSFFSIPKLVAMRQNEISIYNIIDNFSNFCSIIFHQSDKYIVNATNQFGIFYHISLPFFLLGLFSLICDIINSSKKHQYNGGIFIIINFMTISLLGLLVKVNITKINTLFLPMIIITSYGINKILLRFPKIFTIIITNYLILFVLFINYYFTDYENEIKNHFYFGSKEMIEYVSDINRKIYVTPKLPYPVVLFYSKENVNSYIDTVQYKNYPSTFLETDCFTKYSYNIDLENIDEQALYLLDDSYDASIFIDYGYKIKHSDGVFYLAYKQ